MANWLTVTIIKNRRLNDYLTSLIIDAPSLPDFEAGQFVRIGLYDGDEVLARPYSLINTPQEPFFGNLFQHGCPGAIITTPIHTRTR
jgi:ferredoxin--NADP+ reductase